MKKKTILYLILFLSTISCKQDNNKSNITNKKKMSKEIISIVDSYKEYPNYSIQIEKGGCKVELLGNGLPYYTIFTTGGFSALIPFNANILKSGQQKLTVRIFPDEGKEKFDDYTLFSAKVIYYENDKNNNVPGDVIQTFILPKEVIDNKLPFYETDIIFNAKVPFDFSNKLNNAQDLSKIPNVEEKVLSTYNKIIKWLNDKDLKSISDFRREADEKLCQVFYYNDEKDINEMFDYSFLFEDNKKPNSIEPYKIVFYANNRLVRLESLDKNEVITLTGRTIEDDEITTDLSILLYLPIGEKEFKNY